MLNKTNAGTNLEFTTINLASYKKNMFDKPSIPDGLDFPGCSAVASFLVGDDAGLE